MQVRSWITGLLRLSLCQGSIQDGILQHDIVRDYAISRCPDLCALQKKVLGAFLSMAPEGGWPEMNVRARTS